MELSIGALETNSEVRKEAARTLRRKGWLVVDLSNENLPNWTECFDEVFNLPLEFKESGGKYRSTHGVSVGYKQDKHREFLECHRRTDGIVSPNYDSGVSNYQNVTQTLYNLQSRVASEILRGIAELLELDCRIYLDLTDLLENGQLQPIQTQKDFDSEYLISEGKFQALSSSVLRVCKYDGRDEHEHPSVMFGAHTDTSFLTIGMHCSTPGLEILDLEMDEWVCPETMYPLNQKPYLTVFTGEFLQILTKQYFQAAVHRVTSFAPTIRISCPFIIRGRDERKIFFQDPNYHHPGGSTVLSREYIPDLDDMLFGSVHKILDVKRSKVFRQHEHDDISDWVLAAYPVASQHFLSNNR